MGIAQEFYRFVDGAVSAHYSNDEIFEEHPDLRLDTQVAERNESFAVHMEFIGHFHSPEGLTTLTVLKGVQLGVAATPRVRALEELTTIASTNNPVFEPCKISAGKSEAVKAFIKRPSTVPFPYSGILNWLEKIYSGSRGIALGEQDTAILGRAVRKQTSKWGTISHGYPADILFMTDQFMRKLLSVLCPDARIRAELERALQQDIKQRYQQAVKQLEFVLDVERNGKPVTLNHYYNDNLQTSRQKRHKARLEPRATGNPPSVRLEDIVSTQNMSNDDHNVKDLHDQLDSYVKVARKRFVDNVVKQVTDRWVVTARSDGPLRVFSLAFVSSLTKEQLNTIAGDDINTMRKRAALMKQKLNLEEGEKILFHT